MKIEVFECNFFAENTYILWDETKEAVIIDPGCYTSSEQKNIQHFIEQNNLKLTRLLMTHCHVDHVLGNAFIHRIFNLLPEYHVLEGPVLASVPIWMENFRQKYDESPIAEKFIDPGDLITFGNTTLETLFVSGHSPGSIAFYNRKTADVISGDVLFLGSIGRTDLPGGNFETLIQSIENQILPLGDDVKVWPGHGPVTTVGREKMTNPFLV